MLKYNLKKFSFIKILMSGFLFLFIFSPTVILPFNVLHILTMISLFFLFTKYQKKAPHVLKSPVLLIFIALMFFITIYAFILRPLSPDGLRASYNYAVTILELVPCTIFISLVLLEHKVDLNKFYDIILFTGMLQVACVILTMILPDLREWIIASAYDKTLEDTYEKVSSFRMYGLARGYTFSMPLFQGFCVIISFVLGSYKSSLYYLLIPFFMVSIVMNARIAMICLFIVPFVVFFFKFKKQPIKQIVSILFLMFFIFISMKFIQNMSENSSSYDVWFWLNSGIEELTDFQKGEKTGNLSALTDTMWHMPKEIYELIFGAGETVFARGYMSSDIGYVINLYYGGIVFSSILYLSYLFLLIEYYSNNIIEKNISVSLILYLLAANLKGNVFTPNEVINGILLLIVFSISYRKVHSNETMKRFYPSGKKPVLEGAVKNHKNGWLLENFPPVAGSKLPTFRSVERTVI